MNALALVLKSSSFQRLAPFIPNFLAIVALLPAFDNDKVGSAAARTRVKLVGRIALLQLQACPNHSCATDRVEHALGELVASLALPVSYKFVQSSRSTR